MGLYDHVRVSSDWCQCSEGHDLRDESFQTKDLGESFGNWTLDQHLVGKSGGWGETIDTPVTGTIEIYTSCPHCPAFVQDKTWNVLQAWVEFEVKLSASRVISVRRLSEPTATWLSGEQAAGSEGPMSLERALEICNERRNGSTTLSAGVQSAHLQNSQPFGYEFCILIAFR
jgi:hypothetical protein